MKKTALEIYALGVCGLLMIPLVVAGGIAAHSVVQLAWPGLMMPAYEYQRYQSDDAFREHLSSERRPVSDEESPPQVADLPTDSDITVLRTSAYLEALERGQRQGAQSIIRCVAFGAVSLVLFLLHWRIARRERMRAEQAAR